MPAIIMAACGHLDEFVQANVERVLNHTLRPYTLILIDDNSPDATGDYFETVADVTIHNTDNYGLAYFRNQGLRAAMAVGADPIIQLDSDTEVRDGWLEFALRALDETDAWIVGMSGINVSGAPEYHPAFQTDQPAGESARRRQPADYIQSCLWVARGDIVERVGWWDDVFCNWSGEDFDYGLRTWIKGGTCWQTYIPAFHPGGGKTAAGVPKANHIYKPPPREEPFVPDPPSCKWQDQYWASRWPCSMAEKWMREH